MQVKDDRRLTPREHMPWDASVLKSRSRQVPERPNSDASHVFFFFSVFTYKNSVTPRGLLLYDII